MAGASVTPAAAQPAPPPTGPQLVASAQKYLGTPYVFGGNPYSPGQFLSDCSGLIDRAFADLGAKLPGARPTTRELITMGTAVPDLAHALPGDLVFLEGGDHVGIYEGHNRMIDDPTTGQSVHEGAVYQTPMAIRRLTNGTAGATAPAGTAAPAGAASGVTAGLTDWLDSVALRVGAVLLGGALVLVGLNIAIPSAGAAVAGGVRRGAKVAAIA